MAEAKNNFIKSKMNKDLDERLIPNNEYRDALNIAVSRSEGSDVGALEAILGNFERVGLNNPKLQIIGTYVDQTNNVVYYFASDYVPNALVPVAPLTATCTISIYSVASQSSTILVEGSWLNFSTEARMNGVNLLEDLLFFSDNRNQPRKINVNTASSSNSYYFNEDQISVAKFAPYIAPQFLNLRSLAAIKPSTMSDASDPPQTEISPSTFSSINLDVSKYRNGEAITQATTPAAWTLADTDSIGAWCYYENQLANGVIYGKLYNKHAVLDSRILAPKGFTIMSPGDWTDIGVSGALRLKSIDLWDNNPGSNTTGFDALPSGYREYTSNVNAFTAITTEARFWTNDAIVNGKSTYIKMSSADQLITQASTGNDASSINGYAVRLKRDTAYNGWNGDPDFLTEKFVRFSYRFKFDDNEYSLIAPFSQDVFIPQQEGQFLNENETQAFITTVVEFMQNSVNNAVLNIELPSLDIITDYKIKAIDIVFKESDMQAYQILETIKVDQAFISNLNNTNIYQYDYQSTMPIKTLSVGETTRVYDKVPVTARAQEVAANRVMYGNYVEGKSGQRGLDYFASVSEKENQQFVEYPQHSLKQNRNYQVGIILADKFGRQTDIILSNYDGLLDANGDPQPGSNVFSDYSSVGFNTSVDTWLGNTLDVNFNSLIPEAASANNIAGYPGAYAVGNYYTIPIANVAYNIFFIDYSTQVLNTVLNQVDYDFTGIVYSDTTVSANNYKVFKNIGNGWQELTFTTDYTVTDQAGSPRVTLTTALAADLELKFELLFTANNYYKYRTGTTVSQEPLFPNFATLSKSVFDVGKTLSGFYKDYVEIKDIDTVGTPTDSVELFTDGEVASKYLFNNSSLTRPESALVVGELPRTYATYDINVDGFYSYKIGIKQQQQDYYNVYLPGIINGYPIQGETKEQGETAFITLIADNINKVPRNLENVGPLQNQFTSDVKLFGRVTNTLSVTSSGITYRNTQFDPLSSADDVNLVGTIKDVFPDVASVGATLGDINEFCIYNYNEKPFIAKISTQKAIGIVESLFTVPASGYEYPSVMGLAVYETSPYVSPLELFYESTTTGLISDLNYAVQNVATGISGISITSATFTEDAVVGTRITEDFYPLVGGSIETGATAVLSSVFNYNSIAPNALNTNNNLAQTKFILVAGANLGSFYIKTADTFYAGSVSEPNYYVDYAGQFLATINFTFNNTIYSQTLTLQLANSAPVISQVISPTVTGTVNGEMIFNASAGGFGNNPSPAGYNGSASDPTTSGVPSDGNWAVFNPPIAGWSVIKVQTTNVVSNVVTVYTSASAILNIVKITQQALAANAWRFSLQSSGPNGNTPGIAYELTLQLTDTNGSATTAIVSYAVAVSTFTTVVSAPYTSGTGYTTASNTVMVTSPTLSMNQSSIKYPRWIGQIQNWTTNTAYLFVQLSTSSGPNTGFAARIGNVSNASTATSGNVGNRLNAVNNNMVNAFVQTCPAATTSSGASTQYILIGTLNAFTNSQQLINGSVRPGQVNTVGGNFNNYNFDQSTLVNIAMSISGVTDSGAAIPPGTQNGTMPLADNPTVKLYWSSVFAPTASQVTEVQSFNPLAPFFPNAIGGTNQSVSPTATGVLAATGPSS